MQSERIKFIKIETRHAAFLFDLLTDVKVRKYLGGILDASKARSRVEALLANPPLNHWVMQNEISEYIGSISLDTYYDDQSIELSYKFMPKFWRQGYAHEAIRHIGNYAQENMGIDHLIAETQMANNASIQLLTNIGFLQIDQVQRFKEKQGIYQLNLLDRKSFCA